MDKFDAEPSLVQNGMVGGWIGEHGCLPLYSEVHDAMDACREFGATFTTAYAIVGGHVVHSSDFWLKESISLFHKYVVEEVARLHEAGWRYFYRQMRTFASDCPPREAKVCDAQEFCDIYGHQQSGGYTPLLVNIETDEYVFVYFSYKDKCSVRLCDVQKGFEAFREECYKYYR